MEAFEYIYNKSQLKANPRKMKEEIIRMFDSGDQRSFEEIYGKDSPLFEDVDDVIDPRKRKLFEEVYRNGNQIRLKEKSPNDYTDDEWDNMTEEEQEKNQKESSKSKGQNPNIGPFHNKYEESFENKYELSEDRKADLKLKEDTFQDMYQTEKEELREEETFNELYGEQLNENTEDDWNGLVDLKEKGPPGGYNFSGDEPGPSGDGVPAAHNKPGIGGSDPAVAQSGQDYDRNTKFFERIYKKTHEKVLDKLDEWLEEDKKKLIETTMKTYIGNGDYYKKHSFLNNLCSKIRSTFNEGKRSDISKVIWNGSEYIFTVFSDGSSLEPINE